MTTGISLLLCADVHFIIQGCILVVLYINSVTWFGLHIVISMFPKFGVAILLDGVAFICDCVDRLLKRYSIGAFLYRIIGLDDSS